MSNIDPGLRSTNMAVHAYSDGAEARVYGKPRDANPHLQASREYTFWLDGWSHFDEMNGGGPRTGADYSQAPFFFFIREFERFFVVPVVEEASRPTFGDWSEFPTSQDAARAGRAAAADWPGVIVVAAEQVVEDDENFYQPIAIFGNVPESLLGLLPAL